MADAAVVAKPLKVLVICTQCVGSGTVPREASEIAAVDEYVRPMFAERLCEKCNGSGKVPLNPQDVRE